MKLLKLATLLVVLCGLAGCKIELDIFGSGTVETASGTFDCTSDGTTQSGDCFQQYTDADGTGDTCDLWGDIDGDGTNDKLWDDINNDGIKDPGEEFTQCLQLTATIEETWIATPDNDDTFDGYTEHCNGTTCTHTITESDADATNAVTIEAYFDTEAEPLAVEYTYNYLGQRVSKTIGTEVTYYVYDEAGNLLSEIDGAASTASNNVSIKDYVYLEGEYVAHIEQTGDTGAGENQEQAFFPFNDHLGRPFMAMRTDSVLNMSHEQYAAPFGKMHAIYRRSDLGDPGPEPINQRFPGQYDDAYFEDVSDGQGGTIRNTYSTGYYQNWHRDYDPSIGRYLQSDPIGLNGGVNTYLYAGANSVNWIDFYGLDTVRAKIIESGMRGNRQQIRRIRDSLNPDQQDIADYWLDRLSKTGQEILSEECNGSVADEFPGEFLQSPLEDILNDKTDRGKKAKKLLSQQRFKKESFIKKTWKKYHEK